MDEEQRVEAAKIGPTCKGGKKNPVRENQGTASYAVQSCSHEDEGRERWKIHVRVRDMFMKCLVVKSITQALKKPKDG